MQQRARDPLFAVAIFGMAIAIAAAQTPPPVDSVGAIGPVRGNWSVDGKPATLGAPVLASVVFAQSDARPTSRSIAFYLDDGRLVRIACPADQACATVVGVPGVPNSDETKRLIEETSRAIVRYRVPVATPPPGLAGTFVPADAVAQLGSDGAVNLGDAMRDLPHGAYTLVLRPLDAHGGFVPAGDPLIKLYTWNGNDVSVTIGGVPEGLYAARLYPQGSAIRDDAPFGWVAVLSGARDDDAAAAQRRASALAATWNDPTAAQTFLRAVLANAVLQPRSSPAPRRHSRA